LIFRVEIAGKPTTEIEDWSANFPALAKQPAIDDERDAWHDCLGWKRSTRALRLSCSYQHLLQL